MLVYGDRVQVQETQAVVGCLGALLARAAALPPGIARHGTLAGAFIAVGELTQGIADAGFAARGADASCPATEAAMALLLRCAGALRHSWESGFAAGPLPAIPELPELPGRIEIRQPEGFAFYALYPEAYAMAAAAAGLPPATRVIGLRSIGVPLGAMVASALGAAAPVTLRPAGHPFRRELAVAPALAARLLPAPDLPVAVVDEGPGLSGSSFGAVADWLEDRGVPPGRIAFFPSHGGAPGPMASPRHRARWDRAARHWQGFETVVQPRLAAWAGTLTGPAEGPLTDISGGAWRAGRYPGAAWPPVHAQQERRKFLLPAGGATWLLKFVGLGADGERKAGRGRALAEAGFTPPVAGWCHGFLVERWLEAARPLDPARMDQDRLAEQVGRYLGFRARAFPAAPEQGASPASLLEMARHNAGLALGEAAARRFDRWTAAELAALGVRARPVETDNRLHAWEWLALPDGRLLKADALDHHAAHDLIGCQDIAWDVAGAMVELGLDARLIPILEAASGRPVDPGLLALLLPCYCAFQLGHWTMAAEAAPDAEEAARLRAAVARYAARLQGALAA
ncbi:hypothetical protein [Roseicella aerolata]|uniref:Uncharacterized protein n=1 Tax=Roseicella aerolata TaxID=2883479 RepID=A0A9X1L6L2_9PROT|nr:hypothetical protein [Roseicella aerolata]MCB4820689.1 hypothetical protein [Roseicella aerolata]